MRKLLYIPCNQDGFLPSCSSLPFLSGLQPADIFSYFAAKTFTAPILYHKPATKASRNFAKSISLCQAKVSVVFLPEILYNLIKRLVITRGICMRERNEERFQSKKHALMETCFACYAENGLSAVGIRGLAKACGCNSAVLYTYFEDLDDLIIQSTAYCMTKVEDDFMQMAPEDPKDAMRFIEEIPYWTAQKHGKQYRLMYQVYTHPKYIAHGKAFFEGVNERYRAYAERLEPKIGIPADVLTPLIFIFVRACVHYAMFEDEYYLKSQMEVLKQSVKMFIQQYKKEKEATK